MQTNQLPLPSIHTYGTRTSVGVIHETHYVYVPQVRYGSRDNVSTTEYALAYLYDACIGASYSITYYPDPDQAWKEYTLRFVKTDDDAWDQLPTIFPV